MAAGQGFIEFSTGDVLTAAAANGYLASQVVMVFASAAARTSAIASPQEGMFSYLKDTNSTEYYSGAAWVAIGGAPAFVGCAVSKTANQSIANATYTAVTFDAEGYDTDAIHDNSTNNTRFTIPAGKGGKWLITGVLTFASNTTGFRFVRLYKNGAGFNNPVGVAPVNGDTTQAVISYIVNFAAADYLELYVYQNSTGALNLVGGSEGSQIQFTYLGA